MFGQDFDIKVWSKDFEFRNLIKICVRTCFFGKQDSTLGSVVPLAMFDCLTSFRICLLHVRHFMYLEIHDIQDIHVSFGPFLFSSYG